MSTEERDGTVVSVVYGKGYAFLLGDDGEMCFAHRAAMAGPIFDRLEVGDRVAFVAAPPREGRPHPRALRVRVKGHHVGGRWGQPL